MGNGDALIHSFTANEPSEANYKGLTKREYFAGLAMQGLLASGITRPTPSMFAEKSVELSDALLYELEKPHP